MNKKLAKKEKERLELRQNFKNFIWRVATSVTLGVYLWVLLTMLGVFR